MPKLAPARSAGQSILPLLPGQRFARDGSLHWETSWNAAVLHGEWKLVHQYWMPPRLYRIGDDISESHNLADKHPDKVAELLQRHEQWKARHYLNPVPGVTTRSMYGFPIWPAAAAAGGR